MITPHIYPGFKVGLNQPAPHHHVVLDPELHVQPDPGLGAGLGREEEAVVGLGAELDHLRLLGQLLSHDGDNILDSVLERLGTC